MLKEYDIDIALTNSANIRGRFHEGDIDTRDLIQITPFGNKMTITRISEKELVEALDDKVEDSDKALEIIKEQTNKLENKVIELIKKGEKNGKLFRYRVDR